MRERIKKVVQGMPSFRVSNLGNNSLRSIALGVLVVWLGVALFVLTVDPGNGNYQTAAMIPFLVVLYLAWGLPSYLVVGRIAAVSRRSWLRAMLWAAWICLSVVVLVWELLAWIMLCLSTW